MKVAIVHDWFDSKGGAELVVEQLLAMFPSADVYTLVDYLPASERDFLTPHQIHTSLLQHLPLGQRGFRYALGFLPYLIEQFDLRAYDLILSSSHAVAKGVLTNSKQLHLSYIHTPMRYAWDMYQFYVNDSKPHWLTGALAKRTLHRLRQWDVSSSNRADVMLANSSFVAKRIAKIYRREAQVIHPPVDCESFTLHPDKEDYFITASRLVPYKRVDLIVQAFASLPEHKLVVIGDGSELPKLRAMATPNVQLLGYVERAQLIHRVQRARAFIFAAEEDFGIAPVEAQACGTPVIAYGVGGITDSVITTGHNPTGLFFHSQTASALAQVVQNFHYQSSHFAPPACSANAARFAPTIFQDKIRHAIETASVTLRTKKD